MKFYPIDTDVTLTIPFVDERGSPVTPSDATYRVLDGAEREMIPETALAISGASATVTIPASFNATVGPRTVLLNMTTPSGVVVTETLFAIEPLLKLKRLENSFLTYSQAIYIAMGLNGLEDLKTAPRDDQIAALIEAFRRLTRMNFLIPESEVVDSMECVSPGWTWSITPKMWPNMTETLFVRYPAEFRDALGRAQVIQANDILKTGDLDDQVRNGLLSWTVGESKMMLKSGIRPLNQGVCRSAMDQLRGWINNRITITRS